MPSKYGETITRLSKGVHEYLHDGLRVQQWNALNGLVQWHCLRLPPLPRQPHALLSHTCTYGFWTYQWFRVTAMAISIGKADWSESRTWLRIAPRSAMRDLPAVHCGRSDSALVTKAFGMKGGNRTFAESANFTRRSAKADLRHSAMRFSRSGASYSDRYLRDVHECSPYLGETNKTLRWVDGASLSSKIN